MLIEYNKLIIKKSFKSSMDYLQSSSSSLTNFTNALLWGAGITLFSPFTDCHITSFNSRSGTASGLEKLKVAESFAAAVVASFLALISTFAGFTLYGVISGWGVKQLHIGVAATSYWLMGGSPKISSTVRSMAAVLNKV